MNVSNLYTTVHCTIIIAPCVQMEDQQSISIFLLLMFSDPSMPASKKDLKKLKQKQNVAAGIGDAKGRLPSNNKVTKVKKGGLVG